MKNPLRSLQVSHWRTGVAAWLRRQYVSRRVRHWALGIAIALAAFGVLGFLVAPPLIKGQLQKQLSAKLDRPVTVGAVHLDPFTLRLELDKLHIADRDGHRPFVDVDQLVVNASWTSLFRLAPVLDAVSLRAPQIHVTRTAPQRFNFSDLIDKFANQPSPPDAKPAHFALSNIQVSDGSITFDDAVTKSVHHIDHLELGIPFLANLPRDTQVFVQPLLAMNIDGSPIRLAGHTKPFASTRESVLQLTLDRIDLPRYLGYSPVALSFAVPRGTLSGHVAVHFAQAAAGPQVRLGGDLQLDQFALATPAGAPIIELGHADVALDDVEPLLSRYHLGAMRLDTLAVHYTLGPHGRSTFDALTGASSPAPAAPTTPTDLRIASIALKDGRLAYTDGSSGKPATLALANLHGTLQGLATLAAPPATVDIAATLNGGTLAAKGQLDLAAQHYTGSLAATGVGIAPLQALAPPLLAADIASGTLDAGGQWRVDWHHGLDIALQSGTAAVRDLALQQGHGTPLKLASLEAGITQFDLSDQRATLDHVAVRGLRIEAQRNADGTPGMPNLLKPQAPTRSRHAQPTTAPWHWAIQRVTVDDSTLAMTPPGAPGRRRGTDVTLHHAQVDGLSDDFHKPLKLALEGGVGRGSMSVDGSVRLTPIEARLRVRSQRLDVAALQSLVSVPLNVTVASALVSADGHLDYRARATQPLVDWHGRATLGNVRVLDKLTGDDFLRWNSLTADGMDVRMGDGVPRVVVAGLALSDFYARLIINRDGHLNLRDVVAAPTAAPVSVTRAAAATPPPATSAPAPAATTTAPAADIRIGQITLARGHLNYTDDFIKPNYTADITNLDGSVGSFGTAGGPPAAVSLQGELDDNSPVNITGTIDPLAPVAALDIKGKADGVELTHMSPYSGKYTGYPITKGRLTVDVHYQLDHGKLTADNHLFIDQLTFGDRIEGPGISHLPVKLAVALLKNAQGQIDVHVPVSGSLDDPHFSVGGLVWQAFVHLIGRAVTSPFRLLGAAFGGGGDKDLGQVAFAPGSAVLDAAAQAQLQKVVDMLTQKTSLKLNITGRAAPALDEEGLRKVTVDGLVQQEAGGDVKVSALSAEQYDKYLKKAYRHASFSKPRDVIGLTKSQPPDVMRKLLESHVATDADAMRHLAERRADAVRAWLRGKLADDRVFVLAPVVDTGEATGTDSATPTRVDLGLTQ